MTVSIRTLKIDQRWDCRGCGVCCRGSAIDLDDEELKRLGEQRWQEHPDYAGRRIVVGQGLWKKRYRLAKRDDGSCVFSMPDGRCRIHAEHGPGAKPLICRMFPFQLIPLGDFAYLTLRRSCPAAAAERGRKLDQHLRAVNKLVRGGRMAPKRTRPPAIARRHRRSWKDTLRVLEVLEWLMLDDRYPIVRRLVHGLAFCGLLQRCRLHKFSGDKLAELLTLLGSTAPDEVGELFGDRTPPERTAGLHFRRTALEYLRLQPKFAVEEAWAGRWRLVRAGLAMARGAGRLPSIHPDLPEATFEALERPLGHLPPDVLRPIAAYFEASAASKQYAILGRRGWSIVESFRALALSHAVGLWMLRLVSTDRAPTRDDSVGVVAAIDRGQGFAPLAGYGHQRRVAGLTRLGQLPRLVAWYAR